METCAISTSGSVNTLIITASPAFLSVHTPVSSAIGCLSLPKMLKKILIHGVVLGISPVGINFDMYCWKQEMVGTRVMPTCLLVLD